MKQMTSVRNSLTDSALRWVIDSVHPDASVRSVKTLHGGVSSLVYGITLNVGGEEKAVVLRQFDNEEWVRDQPDLAVREAESLRRAACASAVRTPEIIAFDETGSRCGTPAVLMTMLKGNVVLDPPDIARWLDGMAKALARVHAVEADGFPWTFAPYCDASTLDATGWSRFPDLWRRAADFVARNRPNAPMRFIHRDYHPANILWDDGEVSGVVDWVNGCVGPAGIDVGHCRVNLAQLHDVRAADEFLASYMRHAGEAFAYDPYWDLVTLIDYAYWPPDVYGGWTALGMKGLTKRLIEERLDLYLLSVAERISLV